MCLWYPTSSVDPPSGVYDEDTSSTVLGVDPARHTGVVVPGLVTSVLTRVLFFACVHFTVEPQGVHRGVLQSVQGVTSPLFLVCLSRRWCGRGPTGSWTR